MQAADPIIDLAYRRHAVELRESWQGRVLAPALVVEGGIARPRDPMGAVVLSVLAHSFDEALPVLLRVVFPGFRAIGTPFFCTAARIAKTGDVMADLITRDGRRLKNQKVFSSTRQMESRFRRIADAARLEDAGRAEFIDAAKRWVVCDYRLDPTMNPADPDAKRLTVH